MRAIVVPQSAASPAPAGAAQAGTVSTEARGPAEPAMLLRTPLGLLKITSGPRLPEGTEVTVQISDVRVPPTPARPIRPPFDTEAIAAADLTRGWDSLNKVLKAVDFTPPPASVGQVVVPAFAGTKAASAPPSSMIQFLLAALRLGDLKSWLGSDIASRASQSVDPGLQGSLSRDFGTMSRAAHDGTRTEWRPFVLPVHDGSGIQPVAWFIRRPYQDADRASGSGGNPDGRPDDGTRFLLELDHKSLGEMQLDGLVHRQRFDLVVRSHAPLADKIRQDITELFHNILDRSGVTGDVMFHPGRKFPLALRADMAHRAFEARPHPDRA